LVNSPKNPFQSPGTHHRTAVPFDMVFSLMVRPPAGGRECETG
jgi:hypothetical protein